MINLKNILLFCSISFFLIQNSKAQEQSFLLTKGDSNISIISTGSVLSTQCTVIEYPDFLVVHEIPIIPKVSKEYNDSEMGGKRSSNPLITFIDSIYLNKPIKYILNSHHHRHSLSTVMPFFEVGAKLITTEENIEIYTKRGLFSSESAKEYSESIIGISSDTVLLAETENPIEVLYLKKADYRSIPTETFLFFYFPAEKLLAASCMVHLQDFNEKYGLEGVVYNDRLIDANKIIADKNLEVENTLQLFRMRFVNGNIKPPIFPISYMNNVLQHSWHRRDLAQHFEQMTIEDLNSKQDSILAYLGENDIYHSVLNHAVYSLIEKKEYKKAVAIAHILIIYEPRNLNELDTLGEAYFNNGQVIMAKHYDSILRKSGQKMEGLGLAAWEENQKKRLKQGI